MAKRKPKGRRPGTLIKAYVSSDVCPGTGSALTPVPPMWGVGPEALATEQQRSHDARLRT